MDMQCRLVTPTPIQYLGTGPGGQRIYIKRDDLLGFSFGGNKCRIAEVLLQDMKEKGCDFFVSYGSRKSNLNRVVGTLCKAENIPCLVITALEDGEKEDTFNSRILERMEIQSVFCDKSHVRETVEQTLADLREKGYHPYYIYGDSSGKGNESAVRKAYAAAYEEIRQWEKQNRIYFRQIFHASGTGMTQGGLVAGQKAVHEKMCRAEGEKMQNREIQRLQKTSDGRSRSSGSPWREMQRAGRWKWQDLRAFRWIRFVFWMNISAAVMESMRKRLNEP